jgi:hypothetical protein
MTYLLSEVRLPPARRGTSKAPRGGGRERGRPFAPQRVSLVLPREQGDPPLSVAAYTATIYEQRSALGRHCKQQVPRSRETDREPGDKTSSRSISAVARMPSAGRAQTVVYSVLGLTVIPCCADFGLIEGQLCHESARQSGDLANGTRDCECRDGIGLDEPLARLAYREDLAMRPTATTTSRTSPACRAR